jgi:hypothetical protein
MTRTFFVACQILNKFVHMQNFDRTIGLIMYLESAIARRDKRLNEESVTAQLKLLVAKSRRKFPVSYIEICSE